MLGPNNKDDLKSISDFNSKWADRIALLILVGLLLDITEVLVLGRPWPEWMLTVLANSFIMIGVYGELWFAKRAREADDSRVAEANARAAEANQKAAEVTLELVRYRAPRRLGETARDRISEKLRPFKDVIFDTGWAYPNEEQHDFVWDLEQALTSADWNQVDWPGGWVTTRSSRPKAGIVSVSDVSIQLHPSSNALFAPAAAALVAALNDEDIAARVDPLNVPGTSENAMHVMIGNKR